MALLIWSWSCSLNWPWRCWSWLKWQRFRAGLRLLARGGGAAVAGLVVAVLVVAASGVAATAHGGAAAAALTGAAAAAVNDGCSPNSDPEPYPGQNMYPDPIKRWIHNICTEAYTGYCGKFLIPPSPLSLELCFIFQECCYFFSGVLLIFSFILFLYLEFCSFFLEFC